MPLGDTINFPRDFNITELRRSISTIYRSYHQLGYQDITLDFSACEHADPSPMVGLIAYCNRLSGEMADFTLALPEFPYLRRLFQNCNWAHFLCPDQFA